MLKHVKFHLKTDYKNLVYINCALTGKVARWKLYMEKLLDGKVALHSILGRRSGGTPTDA